VAQDELWLDEEVERYREIARDEGVPAARVALDHFLDRVKRLTEVEERDAALDFNAKLISELRKFFPILLGEK
jgi:hypothetical protein